MPCPFFSTIVLSKKRIRFPWVSGGVLERRIPGKNGEGTRESWCSRCQWGLANSNSPPRTVVFIVGNEHDIRAFRTLLSNKTHKPWQSPQKPAAPNGNMVFKLLCSPLSGPNKKKIFQEPRSGCLFVGASCHEKKTGVGRETSSKCTAPLGQSTKSSFTRMQLAKTECEQQILVLCPQTWVLSIRYVAKCEYLATGRCVSTDPPDVGTTSDCS